MAHSGRGVKPGTRNAAKSDSDKGVQAGRISSALLDKAKEKAEKDGVKLRYIIESALIEYLNQ